MSTPDNHGKKAPQFAAFKPLTTVQNPTTVAATAHVPARQLSLKTSPAPAIAGKSAAWTAPPVRAR